MPGGDNVIPGDALIYSFKYEKTIDMTNAADRSTLPDASFSYTASTIGEDEAGDFGIGDTYTDQLDETYTVNRGVLKDEGKDVDSVPFSTVTFSSQDQYWPELSAMIASYKPGDVSGKTADDERAPGAKIVDYMIANTWGELRSSTHSSTVIVRPSTSEEKAARQAREAAGEQGLWPADRTAFKLDVEPAKLSNYLDANGSYKAENGPETTVAEDQRHDLTAAGTMKWSSDFSYANADALYDKPAIQYVGYAIRAPYLTDVTKDAAGKDTSVSTSLFSPEEYEAILQVLESSVPEEENGEDEGTQIYRYVLTEDEVDQPFAANTQKLVLDYVVGEYGDPALRIFNSVKDAQAYYENIGHKIGEGILWDEGEGTVYDIPSDLSYSFDAPKASFTNTYVPPTPPTEPPTPTDPPTTPVPSDPPTTPPSDTPSTPVPTDPPTTPPSDTPSTPPTTPAPSSPATQTPKPKKVKGLAKIGAQAAAVVLAGAALLASGGIALAARRLRDQH